MTGSTVLVVRVPRPIEDADACIEHIKRGLRDGILILGADVKYSVETFPPLGAVEVVAEPVPVVIDGSKPTPSGGGGGLVVGGRVVRSVPDLGTEKDPPQKELPDIPAAEGVSRPEPKPPAPPPERPPAEKPKPAEAVSLRLPAQPKAAPKPVRETEPVFVGQGSIEKLRIHERLTRYWQAAGPGAMQRLADQIGWPVANVYGAQRAERFDMDHWRQLDRGMDALGFELEGGK